MKITKVNIENFLTVGPLVSLTLDQKGMVLITGDNRDDTSAVSNGAGKSTIGDAICWALYNETARSDTPGGSGKTGDDVINNVVGKGCSVEVIVEDAGVIYSIVRYRKHKQHKNSLQVHNMTTMTDLTKGTDKLTQELVVQITGCSFEVFRSAIYAAQDSIPNLPGMTDKNLKEIVEESAGINRLTAAYAIAREDFKTVDRQWSDSVDKLAQLVSKKAKLKDDIEAATTDKSNFENGVRTQISSVNDEIADLANEKAALIKKSLPTGIAKKGVEAQIKRLSEELNAFVDKKNAVASDLSKKEVALTRVEMAYKQAYLKAKQDREAIDSIKDRVGQPCGECGKAYCEEDLEEATKIAKKTYIESKRKVDALKIELEDAKKARSEAADAVASLGDMSAAIAKNKADSDDLRAKLKQVEDTARQFEDVERKIKDKFSKIAELQKAINPYAALINRLTSEDGMLDIEMSVVKRAIDNFKNQRDLLEDAVKVFSPAGVRAHVIDTVTPLLNDRTAHYLSILSDGNINAVWNTLTKSKTGELKEKFAIEVSNDKGANSFGGLSGGEKRKVRIATALALQDLVASRASKPIDLFIADEIDDAIDEAGLERLMMLLEEKAREKGTVLMISHNSLSDWCSNEAVVIKENGFSRVEGALV